MTWVDEVELEWGRLCSGFVKIIARPGGSCWFVGMSVWPSLAAAFDSHDHHIFKPLTAEYLGLVAEAKHSITSRI
jgi:hypothetical protein